MELTAGQTAIIQTVAYFDVLDYPLTLLELHRFLNIKIGIGRLLEELETETIKKIICRKNGCYCLSGRKEIIESRRRRYGIAIKKLGLARRYAGWLNRFPWVRAVGIYSSLSLKNSRPDSDLDFIIVTSAGRVWSARFFINLFLKTFRLRPRPGHTADKICVSYLTDENNLDLSKVNYNDDYYYYYGTGAFLFLAGNQKTIDDFFLANNWLKTYLPNWQPAVLNQMPGGRTGRNWLMRILEPIPEKILGLAREEAYRDYQLKLLPEKYKQAEDGQKVVLSGGMIKLHDNDKRLKYNRLFAERFEKIINADV